MMRMPPSDRRPALQPPQFRLRTLLFGVTGLCILLAASTVLGAYAIFAIILLILSVAGHVAANSLGTRLRANGDHRLPETGEGAAEYPLRYAPPQHDECAPVTQLGRRDSLGKTIIVLTVLGIVAGAVLGWLGLQQIYEQATWFNLGAGALAFAILGGIWGFLGCGFLQVLLAALWQASRGS